MQQLITNKIINYPIQLVSPLFTKHNLLRVLHQNVPKKCSFKSFVQPRIFETNQWIFIKFNNECEFAEPS